MDNLTIMRYRLTTPTTSAAPIPTGFRAAGFRVASVRTAAPVSQGWSVASALRVADGGSVIGTGVDHGFTTRMAKGRPPRGVPR